MQGGRVAILAEIIPRRHRVSPATMASIAPPQTTLGGSNRSDGSVLGHRCMWLGSYLTLCDQSGTVRERWRQSLRTARRALSRAVGAK